MMRAPESRMDILTESEIQEINSKSKLVKKYSELIDRESAYEMLTKKGWGVVVFDNLQNADNIKWNTISSNVNIILIIFGYECK